MNVPRDCSMASIRTATLGQREAPRGVSYRTSGRRSGLLSMLRRRWHNRRVLERCYHPRQANCEGRACPRLAFHRDVAAHHLTEAPTDGEAKPGSAVFARRCRGGLRKLLEQLAHLFRCHSDAGISNRNRNPIAAVLLSLTRIDADGAALSEFVGIAHEVQQRLAQAHLVGLHRSRCRRRNGRQPCWRSLPLAVQWF